MNKPNVIMFGASKGGENFLKNQQNYNVLAIADNNTARQGSNLNDILIISPTEISNYEFEFIVITSMFVESITKQLKEELGIKKDKIIYVPKRLLKIEDCETFGDAETKKLAYQYLKLLGQHFEADNIKWYLNFGTLLGIVRDGDLIAWDDDIDLAIIKNFDEAIFLSNLKKVCVLPNVDVEFIVKRKPALSLVGVDVIVKTDHTIPFTISVDLLIEEGTLYRLPIDVVPKHYFEEQQIVMLNDIKLYGPTPIEDYLTHVYKDWKVVKRDVTFDDNTTTYDEPKDLLLEKEL